MVDIGKRLLKLRKENGLTQQQVADRVWVSKAMISSYELGSRAPSYDVLIKLAKLFGVSTDYLLGVEETTSGENMIDISKLSLSQKKLIQKLIEELIP